MQLVAVLLISAPGEEHVASTHPLVTSAVDEEDIIYETERYEEDIIYETERYEEDRYHL